MTKLNLLVVSSPTHPSLRILEEIHDYANIWVGNDTGALSERAADADVLLYSGLPGTEISFQDVWEHTRKVKWVHSLTAGVEKVLVPGFRESEVPLTNARGVFKRSLAEFAIFGALYFYKRGRRLVENQQAHRWDDFKVDWLPDRVMGIVGYGEIGRECALLGHALGMKIYATRRNPAKSESDPILEKVFPSESFHEMLHQVDVLVAAAPLTPDTRHMISDAAFDAMKPSAILVNVGRGPVVDEAALVRALREKKIGAAALDVFEKEPLPPDHPLWDFPNVLISPHCTDRTGNPDWMDLTMQFFVKNFDHFRKGEPLENVVDKRAGY
jgi:phosphoglycerate dehydrogenase-like enzyme